EAGALERGLLPSAPARSPATPVGPAWATVHHALKRQGVPLFLVGQEEKAAPPEGGPSRGCCHTDRAGASTLPRVRRQTPRAGETRCGDDAGPGILVLNRPRGEVHEAVRLVAVLGASSATSAAAPWPQSLPDWLGSPVRTLAALGGVPASVVPAPRKAAVPRAHRSAPVLQRPATARPPHGGCGVPPARAAQAPAHAQGALGGQ